MPASLLAAALVIAGGCDGDDGGASLTGTAGDPSSGPSAAASVPGGTAASGTGTPSGGSTTPAGGDQTPVATAPPAATGSTALSIDADAQTAGTQAGASHALAAEFDVVIALDVLAEAAAGYQIDLTWDPAVLAFVSIENAATAEFPACSPIRSGANFVSVACLRTQEDLTYTGALSRITLRCSSAGVSALQLRLPADGVIGTRIESTPAKNFVHELSLSEAEIRCG